MKLAYNTNFELEFGLLMHAACASNNSFCQARLRECEPKSKRVSEMRKIFSSGVHLLLQ